MKSAVWIVAGALFSAAAAQAPPPGESELSAYLSYLHDGRFEAAEGIAAAAPKDARSLFLTSFTTYWKLVFDDDNSALQSLLDRQLDAAVEAADDQSHAEVAGRAGLWGGNCHVLLAQLRAWERRPMAAAFEAKKAKKMLEADVRAGGEPADAYFGLGTYNYMADSLPAYAKGLRALLFLPPGDREKGLDQLEQAASTSLYFAFEARVLLITIFANRHERLYQRAMDERDRLLRQAPDTVASLYASARLDISLGRNDAAIAALERAKSRARSFGDVDPVVLRWIDLLRARAEFAILRPDLAAATARTALATGRGLSPSIRDSLGQILALSERLAEGIDWNAAVPKDDSVREAERVAAVAKGRPETPLLALIAGDAILRAGQPQDAFVWLDRAALAPLPNALKGGCQLRQGQAADLLGQRARALDFYKHAADMPGFAAKDAALFYQQFPYRSGA